MMREVRQSHPDFIGGGCAEDSDWLRERGIWTASEEPALLIASLVPPVPRRSEENQLPVGHSCLPSLHLTYCFIPPDACFDLAGCKRIYSLTYEALMVYETVFLLFT